MQIDLFSFIMGATFAAAIFVLIDRYLPFLGQSRQTRTLRKRIRQLESALKRKDAYIHKALEELKKQHGREVQHD